MEEAADSRSTGRLVIGQLQWKKIKKGQATASRRQPGSSKAAARQQFSSSKAAGASRRNSSKQARTAWHMHKHTYCPAKDKCIP